MAKVRLAYEYYPDFTTGRPVFNGSIFVGEPFLDPSDPGNQKTITLIQEDGSSVSTTQPVATSAGGVPTYNGSPVQIEVDGDYSLLVLNNKGSQVYYVAETVDDGSGGSRDRVQDNYLFNGNFDIWQRGTSFVDVNTEYTADRWIVDIVSGGGGNGTATQRTFTTGQTDVPGNPIYYMEVDYTTSPAAALRVLEQKIEDVRSVPEGFSVLSFYAKADKNKQLEVYFEQNFGTTGSPFVITFMGNVNLTTAWQRFELTVDAPSLSGKTIDDSDDYAGFHIRDANPEIVTIDFAQFQFERGSTATEFQYRPLAEELTLCQRYYYRIENALGGFVGISNGSVESDDQFDTVVSLPDMRINSPVFTFSALADFNVDLRGANAVALTALSSFGGGSNGRISIGATQVGGFIGEFAGILSFGIGSPVCAFIAFDAEL